MKAETRIIHQATYSPLREQPNPLGRRPFLKIAVLSAAMNDRDLGAQILDRLGTTRQAVPHLRECAAVLRALWSGRHAEAVELAEPLTEDNVAAFAGAALAEEERALSEAERDVASTIERLAADAAPASAELAALVKHEVALAREQLTNELRGTLTSMLNVSSDRLADLRAAPAAAVPSVPVVVTRDALHRELTRAAPATAALLGSMRFFSHPKYVARSGAAEAGHALGFAALRKTSLAAKAKLVGVLLESSRTEPIGYLHLERLNFTPVGYVRGDLVYSLPMLPGEVTRLSHREWSRTENEFARLVSTSLEKATEEQLAEKSELTQAASVQEQHSSAFNASVTASGGFGPVTVSTSLGASAESSEASSRQSSAKRAQEITRKASSRAKEEHKISFKVTTQFEVEDTSFRELRNDSEEPVRWDFHRLMRKWKVDLYRYDVRLTYDVVIPEPGSYLLRKHIRLKELNEALAQPNPFDLKPSRITRENWEDLSAEYGVALEPPPPAKVTTSAHAETTFASKLIGWDFVNLSLPDGYEFIDWSAKGSSIQRDNVRAAFTDPLTTENTNRLDGGAKHSARYAWRYSYDWSEKEEADKGSVMTVAVYATGGLTNRAFQAWQSAQYGRLADAAAARFELSQQALARTRDALQAELEREDGLALRKIEKEEIMKGVLRWVLGPEFSFYPPNLPQLSVQSSGDLEHYGKSTQNVRGAAYEPMLKHGEVMKFLHQAIEWENVIYVLYPYFWTDDFRWSFKQELFHNDFVHRSFLRAGAARVVMTIRPGFEKDFLAFVETGKLKTPLASTHPYMTIADELQAMAQTSYPFTPNANDENPNNLVATWNEFTPTGALDVMRGGVLEEDAET